MPTMTQSMEVWLFKYHRDKMVPLMFGHLELFTEEMAKEYTEWCFSEEGRQYLKGGSKYDPNHRGNIACDRATTGHEEIELDMLEIDCNKCGNLTDKVNGCKVYGSDPTTATKACAADGFINFTPGLKPDKRTADHEEYFTKRYRCPICNAYLASYDYGRSWTADGLRSDQLIDCPDCGQKIDWSDEPRAKE